MSYPNLKKEHPTLLKTTTGDDEIKKLKNRREKHDYGKILKSLKIDNHYYRKKYKWLNKKIFLNNPENLKGSSSTIVCSTLSNVNPSIGIPTASSAALITSIAILITNEYISKLKIQDTKLRDCVNVISLLHGQILKQSMAHKKIDDREAQEMKKI